MNKKSGLSMHKFLILLSMIPLVVSLVVLTVFSILYMKDNLETQTRNTLKVAVIDLQEYYAYDLSHPEYLEDGWITYDPEYMDHLKYADVDLTIFRGDTRFCTSIVGDDGKRIEGTKASDAVIAEVIGKGNEYFSDGVVINGQDYFVYYLPLKDGDGNVVGMAFAGKQAREVTNAVNKMILVCCCIAVVLLVLFVFLCLYFANKVAKPIRACADTLSKLADGNLSIENDATTNIAETKALIFASNSLRDKLSEIIGHVKIISGELNTGANNVNKLSEESSRDANQISSAMEDLAEGATDMANNVQEIGKQIGNLN
ncbi:MAG: methyl-accepting chemotaxis protein, partial [Lachnospiraceae bacterium]|nr:methyl-accepting chemotaxis protein [Lachnospiraceae bacterium]